MKYKNYDIAVENLSEYITPVEYKATYPKFFEFYIDKSKDEKSFFLKIWKYRLIVSIDRLIPARLAGVELADKGKPIYKKTGTNTILKLLD
ncbi:hypothetical protein [uncultured phage_Deep1-GF2-KM23-C739]|uniref:Uncharacterized protein n=1 Tax=uncultured phage_Deep1-GF2-KM23-C739 TaxID=2740798 RepID=A0A1B1IVY6_9CAUD|nr:hypothetical protein HOU05_gp11 [uncultured phage_Deep1-GF2-KM23-C739]ANS05481.1 hypothetical protein [uncultured phage_Deep1-GF2-KM23-C739]